MSAPDFLSAPARQAAVVEATGHRPWPLPETPWLHAQTWEGVAFIHWRVDESALSDLLPAGIELDTFGGAAWLGIAAVRITGLRLRGAPPLPGVSSFPQVSVRTYVTREGRAGIWLFALEVGNRVAAEVASRLYPVPCRHARIAIARHGDRLHYDSSRPGAVLSARCRGIGAPVVARPGSLERFLVERYCVYARDDAGELRRIELHHRPWELQTADCAVDLSTIVPAGIALPGLPLAHAAARQDLVVWGASRIGH